MSNTSISISDLCDTLLSAGNSIAGRPLRIGTRSGHVDASFLSVAEGGAADAPFVVVFHGFVDQTKRSLPVFDGLHLAKGCGGTATILAISDSSLEMSKKLNVGWYLGSADLDLPAEISSVLEAITKVINPSRLVFVGGSTGAHAALYHSLRYPNSIAIMANPLTRVSDFHAQHVALYLQTCWPGLSQQDVFGGMRVDDSSMLYTKAFLNKLVVLQNSTDHYLFGPVLRSMANFGKGAAQPTRSVIFLSEFFDSHVGHTYPASPITAWVAAATSNVGDDLLALAKTATTAQRRTRGEDAKEARLSIGASMNVRDVQIAKLL